MSEEHQTVKQQLEELRDMMRTASGSATIPAVWSDRLDVIIQKISDVSFDVVQNITEKQIQILLSSNWKEMYIHEHERFVKLDKQTDSIVKEMHYWNRCISLAGYCISRIRNEALSDAQEAVTRYYYAQMAALRKEYGYAQ